MPILSYEEVLKELAENNPGKKKNLLLGNGFSRVFANDAFSYSSLFDKAKESFNKNILSVFTKVGETNFERALKTYDDALWLMEKYGEKISDNSQKDRDQVRTTLIDIISQNHPDDQNFLTDVAKEKTFQFLEQYSNIFTTNYDLILYWILLYKLSTKGSWDDGFRRNNDILEFTGFREEFCLYYLHGALHLVRHQDNLKKLSWKSGQDKLKNLVTTSISDGTYPVFVAEGDWEKKLNHISKDYYLRTCFDSLGKLDGALVVFGHSLNPTYDRHILDKIASAPHIDRIYIGVYGSRIERDYAELLKYLEPLPVYKKIQFYQSETITLV